MAKNQTERQKKLLKLITENLGTEKPLTMMKMMIQAGFSKETAHQQSNILGGIRDELDPIVAKLEAHRLKVIGSLAAKLSAASYRDRIDAVDKLTKNIQLLSGKATENVTSKVVYLPERKDGGVETQS